METDLIIGRSSEEAELQERLLELGRLSDLLADRELELAEIRMALARFERRYYQQVGRRYAQLDELKARIAQKRAALHPREWGIGHQARQARSRAEQSAREYAEYAGETASPPAELHLSQETKKLYRRIAAQIHPDKAEDERSRALRTRLMAELNEAYAHNDRERMEGILREWKSSPETVAGQGIAARLDRLRRTMERLKQKIAAIDREIMHLGRSHLHQLMTRVAEARRHGRDLLQDLAETIDAEIEAARQELDNQGGEPPHV